jgi:hypothetical protein
MMNRQTICWVRAQVLRLSFDRAHQWRTTFCAPAGRETLDAVVCTVCGVNGWRTRDG